MTTPSSCRKTSWFRARSACSMPGVIGQRVDSPSARGTSASSSVCVARRAIDDAALAAVPLEERRAAARRWSFACMARRRFGRSKPCMKMRGCRSNRAAPAISPRVRASAVAVSAMVCTPPRRRRTSPRSAYSGRKSWPHCETQCASSMASRPTPARASHSSRRRVGEALRRDVEEPHASRRARRPRPARFSAGSFAELRLPASTPKCAQLRRPGRASGRSAARRRG